MYGHVRACVLSVHVCTVWELCECVSLLFTITHAQYVQHTHTHTRRHELFCVFLAVSAFADVACGFLLVQFVAISWACVVAF